MEKPPISEQNPETTEKKAAVIETEQTHEEITRKSKESQASYLHRMGELITQKMVETSPVGKLFDPGRTQEKDLPEDTQKMIENIITEALKPKETIINPTKNEEIIKYIEKEDIIRFHDKGSPTDSISFDKTQRNRKFFEIQPYKGAAKRETYWNTLFFPYNTEAIRLFAKKILDNKKIVLLGGGRSKLQEELQQYNIAPREIVNVDPFVEDVEKGADPIIPLSASDENFIEKMHKQGVENADEIWAEYSVPAYLEDPEEIQRLMQNIDALLATGGSARIWPIEVGFGNGESSNLLKRKNALIESLKKISATNKYEIGLYKAAGRYGLILYKLIPSKKELQEREDQEKTKKIKEKIKKINLP